MKQTNHICSPSKIGQSIKVEWSTCDRNNKGMYSYFYESKKLLSSSMYGEMWQLEKKREKIVKIYFLKHSLIDFGKDRT